MKIETLIQNSLAVLPGVDKRAEARLARPSTETEDYSRFDFESQSSKPGQLYTGAILYSRFQSEVKPRVSRCNVIVHCNCDAYKFYFAEYNWKAGCGLEAPEPYTPVANPKRIRKPNNPSKLPGLCKHLLSFQNFLQEFNYVWK